MYHGKLAEAFHYAPPYGISLSAADTTPAMVIQYVPTLGSGGESSKVRVGLNSIYFSVNGALASDSTNDKIGSTGYLNCQATYTTVGLAVDAINASRAFRAYLTGGVLRSDLATRLLVQASTSIIGANGAAIYDDTSRHGTPVSGQFIGCSISGEKFISTGKSGHVKDWDSQCINHLMFVGVKLGAALTSATMTLNIYQGRQGSAEELLYTTPLTEDTLKELNAGYPNMPFLSSKPGYRLIVRVDTTSKFDAFTQFQVIGKTSVLDGSRTVTEDNY